MQVTPKLRHFHAFRCPTYVLDNVLQSSQGAPKWKHRSRLGVYLGPLPNHAQSVALVLNPRTGHVSPQFHIKFDDFFEMVQEKPTNLDAPELEWKYLSMFMVRKGLTKCGIKGTMDSLLAPQQGPARATIFPSPPDRPVLSSSQQQGVLIIGDDNHNEMDLQTPTVPAQQAERQVPQPQPEQPLLAAWQTHSGRVVCNTARYKQSISKRNQGLIAWEVLLISRQAGGRTDSRLAIHNTKGARKPTRLCGLRQPRHPILGSSNESP